MKHVTLLGDSIRMGYQETVRQHLADRAEVWSPDGNCMHSVHHLFNLAWYLEKPADVIHFNFGLWDCRRMGRQRRENAVPVEIFSRNLDFILGNVRQNTGAVLIWATITPIVQERYNARFSKPFDPCREAGDVVLYNEAAAPILARHEIRINDLHGVVVANNTEKMICEDGVHCTEDGSRLLGKKVAEEINTVLS